VARPQELILRASELKPMRQELAHGEDAHLAGDDQLRVRREFEQPLAAGAAGHPAVEPERGIGIDAGEATVREDLSVVGQHRRKARATPEGPAVRGKHPIEGQGCFFHGRGFSGGTFFQK